MNSHEIERYMQEARKMRNEYLASLVRRGIAAVGTLFRNPARRRTGNPIGRAALLK